MQQEEPPSPELNYSEGILYDDIGDNNGHVFSMQQCPAYAPLPPPRSWLLFPLKNAFIINFFQHYIYALEILFILLETFFFADLVHMDTC